MGRSAFSEPLFGDNLGQVLTPTERVEINAMAPPDALVIARPTAPTPAPGLPCKAGSSAMHSYSGHKFALATQEATSPTEALEH